ncbi:MAG: aminoacetone oxidase family FAD-binding enzyme [Lachnospiraceae bacterium]|nr:aminoacetone oxidase family FAD-binding enzyme [Lachnospiraceae bacterium]
MKIVIIGAGASGLTAAIAAAGQGAEVIILECANKPGKKIYATGNGKCNLTNSHMHEKYYRSNEESLFLVKEALKRFSYEDTRNFFEGLGMLLKEKNGYWYPETGQASSVAELLVRRCEELGVKIICNTCVKNVKPEKAGFRIFAENNLNQEKQVFCSDKLILAAGSRAGGFGCEVTGTKIAKDLGHHVISEVPALTGLICKEKKFFQIVAGVRTDGKVMLREEKKECMIAWDEGELQLTDYGISGIPVFQVSRYAAYKLEEGKKIKAVLEFLPLYTQKQLLDQLKINRKKYGNRTVLDILSCMVNSKLARGLLMLAGIKESQKIMSLKDEELQKIAKQLKNTEITVTGSKELKNAQVCAGGVDTREIDENFQSKLVKNLYIIGEMLDVDGICGGYNLQFAWSGGWIAGKASGERKRDAVY